MTDDSLESSTAGDKPVGSGSPSSTAPKKAGMSRTRWFIENIVSLILALLIVFMIRSSLVEAFKIPSGSMLPTLHIGDHIFVNKFQYGLKIPFSDWLTDHPIFLVHRAPPTHGDIIVFLYPRDESLYYIKRVIGVPGDTVELRNKVVYINQKMVPRDLLTTEQADKIFSTLDDPRYNSHNIDVYTEHLFGVDHQIMLDKNNYATENFGPIVVPPDNFFVMGDNRDFSNDSRYWGFVPFNNVKGKAMMIWLTLNLDFKDGEYSFQPYRIGTVLH